MLNKEDKNWLVKEFVPRDEYRSDIVEIKGDITELKVDSKLLQKAVIRLERNMKENIKLSKKIIATNEGWAGKVAVLEQENNMGAITTRRHGIHIQELAKATGTALSE
ncbi:hypothetical protein A2118_01380 [Candidatus Kaiserbacteria bacterium GWA2_50_9]|uniref:Uncharacterized protein n=1 Tax=Candidatus Kaiserbacteria bacterium GWA2_50_9 TaxID=1798474 RepID=A0A1F6BU80_9BACT|nr:MAG: hypothetical protein A2118_01380 [Candidatus Kaiserbacteria bacterium GWA2_50_9]